MRSCLHTESTYVLSDWVIRSLAVNTPLEKPYAYVLDYQQAVARQHECWRLAIATALSSSTYEGNNLDNINQNVIATLKHYASFFKSFQDAADKHYAAHPNDYTHRFPLTSLRNHLVIDKCIYLLENDPYFLHRLIDDRDLSISSQRPGQSIDLSGFSHADRNPSIIPWSGGTTVNRQLEAPIAQNSDFWGTVKPSMLSHILFAAVHVTPGVDLSALNHVDSACIWSYQLPDEFPIDMLEHAATFLESQADQMYIRILSGGYAFGGIGTYLAKQRVEKDKSFFPMDCSSFVYDFYPQMPQRFSTADHYLLGRSSWPDAVAFPENRKDQLSPYFTSIPLSQAHTGTCWIVRTVESSKIPDTNHFGTGGHMGLWVTSYQTASHDTVGVTLECNRDISAENDDFGGTDGFGFRAQRTPWLGDTSSRPGIVPLNETKSRVHLLQDLSMFNTQSSVKHNQLDSQFSTSV